MKTKIFAYTVLVLAYFFPFRWAYLEHPDPTLVNNTFVETNGMHSMFYFLLSFAAFMFWLVVILSSENKKLYQTKVIDKNFDRASGKAAA